LANPVVRLPVLESGFGRTLRRDAWWAGPAATFVVLSAFLVYATFRAFENDFFHYGPYLSPFYSPYVPIAGLPFLTPAMLILPGPASFRLTCYYYRKAYYRSFAMDPPACAVGERNAHRYSGETKLLLFQNLHRYALYVAIVFLVFLWHDFILSLIWPAPIGIAGVDEPVSRFGVGLGSLVLLANCTFLTLYTFSCHSWRHLIGGGVNSFSTAPLGRLRHTLWSGVSKLNAHHMLFAWVSLFGVALTDLYVRMVASGAIHDIRFF
jgi:hypothetical protein